MMLDFVTALCLMFIVVSANHLGLISKIEEKIGLRLPVINCVKCGTYWLVLIYLIVSTRDVIGAVALSFFFAYLAIWTELAMCVVDYLYMRIYEKVVSGTASDTSAPGSDNGDAPGSVPGLRKK